MEQPAGVAVYVIDDDGGARQAVETVVGMVGLNVRGYASPQEFLNDFRPELRGCVVIDLRLPGMSGLRLQAELEARGSCLPFIIVSGHCDIPAAVEAMKKGAVDFLEKPCNRRQLLDAIQLALEQDAVLAAQRQEEEEIYSRIQSLTQRESEVFDRIINGNKTKEIAASLKISAKTVEVHRSRIMSKLGIECMAQAAKLILVEMRRRDRCSQRATSSSAAP